MRFSHIGFVVENIGRAHYLLSQLLDGGEISATYHDPIQGVNVAFASVGNCLTELIEPASSQSPVSRFLAQGGGLHHLCFETNELDREVERLRAHGFAVSCPPSPAVAFDRRRIAFLFNPDLRLIELV